VSSIFDFLMFGLLLFVFHANQALFQTGWFIESLATQVLVIFVLRTRRKFRSRPHALLAATSIAVVVVAILLPFAPLGAWFGFVPPSAAFLLAIGGLTVGYVLLAQIAKQAFYRVWPPSVGPRAVAAGASSVNRSIVKRRMLDWLSPPAVRRSRFQSVARAPSQGRGASACQLRFHCTRQPGQPKVRLQNLCRCDHMAIDFLATSEFADGRVRQSGW